MSVISMKFARMLTLGLWSVASMALAGGKASPACYENGPQGKAVPTAKTQEECQKLGENHVWKGKGKMKQAKTETSEAAPVAQPAAQPAPASEAPQK